MERVAWSSNIPPSRTWGRLLTLLTDRNNWLSAGLTNCLSERAKPLVAKPKALPTRSLEDGRFLAHKTILQEGLSALLPGPRFPFTNAIWPNLVPGQALGATSCADYNPGDPARNRYLNIGAFSTPAPFTFGNVSQLPNQRLCGYMEENFGIDKEFLPISEHVRIRFGSLFQNAFNRVNWRTLNSDINNPASFGKYQDSYPGRNIQFYLRVEF